MRTRWIGGCALGLAAVGVLTGAARWSEQPVAEAPTAADPTPSDEPGEAHAGLAALAGSWTFSSEFIMPGAEAREAGAPDTGTARVEAILGGRFISVHESGQMMGEPIESMKVFGFNTAAGLYESTWVYSGSTAMMRLRGTSEDGGRITVYRAQYASGPEVNERFLVTMSVRGPDEFVITLVALLPDGSAGPTMQTLYSRQP